MRGVEAAPLIYVIAAIAVVIALSILVLMGKTVKSGVTGATETLNKSVTRTAQKIAEEIGGTLGEEEIIQILKVYKKDKGNKVEIGIFNWKNGAWIKINISDSKTISETLRIASSYNGTYGILECSTTDIDEDGLKDDLDCDYKVNETKLNITSGSVKVWLLDSSKSKVLSDHQFVY